MKESAKNTTVVVAMSGGVDSSVAAAILVESGYNVIGITMKTYQLDEVGGNVGNETSCCGLDAFNDARQVAVGLGIPHYVVDFTGIFHANVITNFVDEYMRGRTPNPCVICNRKIKWGALLEKADALGARFIATGHYAQVAYDESEKRHLIRRSANDLKDQSYALWGLGQDAIARTLFPIGDLSKEEVREMASRYGLKTAFKDESYEICFVADNDYRRFVKERVEGEGRIPPEGEIIKEGKIVGSHSGYPFYTIGQRSGIGAHSERMYVTEIIPENNAIVIGKSGELMRRSLIAKDPNFIAIASLDKPMRVSAMIRYNDTPSAATISPIDNGMVQVDFDEPKRAITPGQSVVFYQGRNLVGGGTIDRIVQ